MKIEYNMPDDIELTVRRAQMEYEGRSLLRLWEASRGLAPTASQQNMECVMAYALKLEREYKPWYVRLFQAVKTMLSMR